MRATVIAVPAKLEEILGSTLVRPLIAPAATAIPKSMRVGCERGKISLPNEGRPTKIPISHAKAIDSTVPTEIASIALRNEESSPANVENAKHLMGSIKGAIIIAPIITAALLAQ